MHHSVAQESAATTIIFPLVDATVDTFDTVLDDG